MTFDLAEARQRSQERIKNHGIRHELGLQETQECWRWRRAEDDLAVALDALGQARADIEQWRRVAAEHTRLERGPWRVHCGWYIKQRDEFRQRAEAAEAVVEVARELIQGCRDWESAWTRLPSSSFLAVQEYLPDWGPTVAVPLFALLQALAAYDQEG